MRALRLNANPLANPLIELDFCFLQKLDHDRELLPIDMCRPAALAAHDEIVAIPVFFHTTFERNGRALNRSLFARLGTGYEGTIISRCKFGERTIVLFAMGNPRVLPKGRMDCD